MRKQTTMYTSPTVEYFRWLSDLIGGHGQHGYVLRDLFWASFRATVPHDENRVEDGLAFRQEFLNDDTTSNTRLPEPVKGSCSIMELMMGLSRRMDHQLYDPDWPERYRPYFWDMLKNIGLWDITDGYYLDYPRESIDIVKTSIARINDRTYDSDGSNGGLFPLKIWKGDQREVELWYQMMNYLMEKYEF